MGDLVERRIVGNTSGLEALLTDQIAQHLTPIKMLLQLYQEFSVSGKYSALNGHDRETLLKLQRLEVRIRELLENQIPALESITAMAQRRMGEGECPACGRSLK